MVRSLKDKSEMRRVSTTVKAMSRWGWVRTEAHLQMSFHVGIRKVSVPEQTVEPD